MRIMHSMLESAHSFSYTESSKSLEPTQVFKRIASTDPPKQTWNNSQCREWTAAVLVEDCHRDRAYAVKKSLEFPSSGKICGWGSRETGRSSWERMASLSISTCRTFREFDQHKRGCNSRHLLGFGWGLELRWISVIVHDALLHCCRYVSAYLVHFLCRKRCSSYTENPEVIGGFAPKKLQFENYIKFAL